MTDIREDKLASTQQFEQSARVKSAAPGNPPHAVIDRLSQRDRFPVLQVNFLRKHLLRLPYTWQRNNWITSRAVCATFSGRTNNVSEAFIVCVRVVTGSVFPSMLSCREDTQT